MTRPETTWPTRRDHLMWGTSELAQVRDYLDADATALAALARRLQRSFLTVHTRRLRLLQQR